MGARSRLRVTRFAALAAALWVGRWLALELASLAGNRVLPRGPAPLESTRQPGRLPGPFDRGERDARPPLRQ